MKPLLNFTDFNIIKESEEKLESFLDGVYESALNESIGAALGSPIKFMKLKKAAKEYQKALVQRSINNLDFEKKVAAGNIDKDKKDVLSAANKQKNAALADKVTAIGQKMDAIATTGGLKTVASIAKNKSQIAAAEIAAKTADGEEAKALKLKIQGLNKKIKANQEELEDYKDSGEDEKDQSLDNVKTDSGETIKDQKDKEEKAKADEEKAKADEEKTKKVEAAQKEIDDAKEGLNKAKEGDDEAAKINAEIAFKKAQIKKAQIEENDELVKGLNDDIVELEKKKEGEPKEGEPKAEQKAVDDATAKLKTASDAKAALKSEATDEEKAAADKAIADVQAELGKAKEALAKAKETDNNSIKSNYTANQYIGESVSDKFRYLMNKNLKAKYEEDFVNEVLKRMISGTSGRTITTLDNRKYELKKDVKDARIADFINVVLPKGTIITNLPGGVFANHKDLKDKYCTGYKAQEWKDPFGVAIRRMPDTLEAIEDNSKVLESFEDFVNESALDLPVGMEQFQKDEIEEGRPSDIYLATFSGKTFKAQFTDKTWGDGVPVTKNFTRGGYKDVTIKGQHYIIEGVTFWYFRVGRVWYAVKRANYGTPPFEY